MAEVAAAADWAEALAAGGVAVRRDVPASELTTNRVGGAMAVVAHARRAADLAVIAGVAGDAVPVLVIGRGSNLLIAEVGFPGIGVVLEGEFDELTLPADAGEPVVAGGAVALPVLARRTAAAGWTGLEFYVGIPGSVGGAVWMNAGGHGRQTADVLVHATVVDLSSGRTRTLDAVQCGFAYRASALGPRDVVAAAGFTVEPGVPAECTARIDEIVRWRREHQPGGANSGSVFTNPPGDAAGRLIEVAGLKDTAVGGARVSPKHANFIQTDPGGTADDVYALMRLVRRTVAERTGVELEPEVRLIGYPPLDAPPTDTGGVRGG